MINDFGKRCQFDWRKKVSHFRVNVAAPPALPLVGMDRWAVPARAAQFWAGGQESSAGK